MAAVLGGIAVISLTLLGRGSADAAWGERAVQWLQARDRAMQRSGAELVMFE